jgi:uridylate kinase
MYMAQLRFSKGTDLVMSDKQPAYKRVLLKISGEAIAGDKRTGLDFDMIRSVCKVVKTCTELGVEIGIVVGGGNFWRGVQDGEGKIERTRADHMGMMATVMNCLALADVLEQMDVPVRVQTALSITAVAEPYIRLRADRHLKNGRVVIFGCGTGLPYFSTDTAAVLRAAEINADVILLAKNVDGVYTADPRLDPNAVKIDTISYDEILSQRLTVMDSTATSLSMDNEIPIILFALHDPENIIRVIMGENIGTRVG